MFHKAADYDAFVKAMAEATGRIPVDLLGYCLMPNHFHLVMRTHADGDLGRWVRVVCSPFSGPPQMGVPSTISIKITLSNDLLLPFLLRVAGRTKFLRRRVPQGAVRPNRVVFPPEPRPLGTGIRHRLEFLPLQEFIAQSAVK